VSTLFINDRIAASASDGDSLLFYPHAQRTGGKTIIKRMLVPILGQARVYHSNYIPEPKRWHDLTDRDMRGYAAYSSMDNFAETRITRPILPIAALRDPVYRAASLYHYIRHKADHPSRQMALSLEMEEFFHRASKEKPKYYCNVQCMRICNRADADHALEVIHSSYLAVGFTGHLQQLASALSRLLGGPQIEIAPKAPDSERYDPQITPAFREMVLECNREDMALFTAMSEGKTPTRNPRRNAPSLGAMLSRVFRPRHATQN
jgi:hypothetical protein